MWKSKLSLDKISMQIGAVSLEDLNFFSLKKFLIENLISWAMKEHFNSTISRALSLIKDMKAKTKYLRLLYS